MLRLLRQSCKRFSTGATSYTSDSEPLLRETLERLPLPTELQGVVVRHLPESIPSGAMEDSLGKWLGVEGKNVRTFYSIFGKPAYSLVSLPSSAALQQALSRHKSQFASSKLYISSVPQFLQANAPLQGGYDPRRVVLSQLDPFWNESHVIEMMKPLGDIMGLYLPRDYDYPHALEGVGVNIAKNLPEKWMHFRAIDEDELDGNLPTARAEKFLTKAYDYFNHEIEVLEKALKEPLDKDNLPEKVGEMADLWGFLRGVKDEIAHKPDSAESLMDDRVNEVLKKPDQANAYEVLLLIRTHGYGFLNSYFQNRGYAYITFATRQQAERAIACSSILGSENNPVSLVFHRNEPGYFFNAGKISEAILEAIQTHADKGRMYEEEKEAGLLTKAVMPMEVLVKKMRAEKQLLGETEDADPVVEGIDGNYESALEKKAEIEKIHYERPENPWKSPRKDLMSSDEEYFDDVPVPDQGRIDASTAVKARASALEKIYPTEKYAVCELPVREVKEEKVNQEEVERQVKEVQRFFNEAVPSVYKDHPHLLKQERFSDHPQVRYVCSEPFDYSSTPAPKAFSDPAEKRKYIRSQIRNFVLTLQLGYPVDKEAENVQEDSQEKPEEEVIHKTPEKYAKFTDSDDEKAFDVAMRTDPRMLKLQKAQEMESSNPEEVHMLLGQTDLSASKKIHYTGDDLDAYIEELKVQYPHFHFTTEKTEQNETYIIATFTKKHLFDGKEIKYLAEKYESQMLSGAADLNIDPKDKHIFEKLESLKDFDLETAAVDLVEQYANSQIAEHIAEAVPTIEEMKDLKELTFPEFIEEYRRRKAEASRS
jgi:hypothetical protein